MEMTHSDTSSREAINRVSTDKMISAMKNEITFGTDGWRAVIAEEFTFENVRTASCAIGNFILKNYSKESPVLIGYDTRFLSEDFAKCCAEVLISLGLNPLISSKPVPTPIIAFWAARLPKNQNTNGAIQFTASHNPPKYCGLKYITNYGGPAPIEMTDEITENIKMINNPIETLSAASLATFEPLEHYTSHIKTLIDFDKIKNSKLKIVYDPLYGAGNGYLDYLLKEAGCEVTAIHNKRDPLFGGLLPEPREENLKELKLSIKSIGAVLGIATDGDADRISAVDQNGTFYSPNQIASMLLRHLYKNKKLKGTVARTLSTTHLMDHLAKKYNLPVVETKVGFKWICEVMTKGNVLIGAEESGGISILNHIPDKDAILAGMLLTEMLAYEKKSLAEIYKDTLKDADWFCINDKFDLHLNNKEKDKFISNLKSAKITNLNGLKIISVNTMEGAKYLFEDGSWFMARASGTEPMARVYFEAASQKTLDIMKNAVQEMLEETSLSCQK